MGGDGGWMGRALCEGAWGVRGERGGSMMQVCVLAFAQQPRYSGLGFSFIKIDGSMTQAGDVSLAPIPQLQKRHGINGEELVAQVVAFDVADQCSILVC